MAERRMFAKSIIDSDAFLEMPLSAQSLYFHLGMRADDDGFINNPRKIMRMINASNDDMKILISKSFVLIFESGIIVIKHWRLNNWIRGDRHKDTNYRDEMNKLKIKDNGSYTFKNNVSQLSTNCQPTVNQVTDNRLPNGCIDKDSLDKNSIDENSIDENMTADDEFMDLIIGEGYRNITRKGENNVE